MPSGISPYALLCASKPKPLQAAASQYDLFSLAQTDSALAKDDMQPDKPPAANMPPKAMQPAAPPIQRTHYIADIHARHTKAGRHAPQSSSPL